MDPYCPDCKIKMVRRKSKYPSSPFFWACPNYLQCTYRAGARKSGIQISSPADEETRAWRVKAHEAFDPFAKQWGYDQQESYVLLQTIMRLPPVDAHIGYFDIEKCKLFIDRIDKIQNGELNL